jgi:hypothetical protein
MSHFSSGSNGLHNAAFRVENLAHQGRAHDTCRRWPELQPKPAPAAGWRAQSSGPSRRYRCHQSSRSGPDRYASNRGWGSAIASPGSSMPVDARRNPARGSIRPAPDAQPAVRHLPTITAADLIEVHVTRLHYTRSQSTSPMSSSGSNTRTGARCRSSWAAAFLPCDQARVIHL